MAVLPIADPDDPRLADFRNLHDPSPRDRRQLFVAEGRLVVRRLLSSSRLVTRAVMLTEPALAGLGHTIARDVPVYLVPQQVVDTVAGFNVHRGCLALGERGAPEDWRTLASAARRLVVLEHVGNADNVGAIFRSAAAFAVDAVLLGPGCLDPLYRKAIRTSMGAALAVPFARLEPWPAALTELRAAGVQLLALTPESTAQPLQELRRTLATPGMPGASGRVAIVAGNEGDGLTRAAVDACQQTARIPMAAGHDSLNVATAVAIALYELFTIQDA